MLWSTISQKQLFDNNMTAWNFTLSYIQFPTRQWQCRGLTHCTLRALTGCFLDVYLGLTLKHCTLFDKKEIKPEKILLVKLTSSPFTSVPYWLMAWQVYFPSLSRWMVAVFVVFTSTVEFRISVVYMGGVPLAEHDSIPPCIANRAAGNVTIGGTNRLEIKIFHPYTHWQSHTYLAIIHAKITSKRGFSSRINANTIYMYTVFWETRSSCVLKKKKEKQRKRSSDICEIIIKHELCMEC